MGELSVAVIGIGNMGKNHLRVCSEIDNLNIIGICDINEKLGNNLSAKYKTNYFKDYKDIFDLQPDFVIIAVPTTYHYEIAKFFIENNIHVLIEKPICKTLEEVEQLIELKKQYGNVKVMVGHIERFNPVINKLKYIIDTEIGDISTFSIKRVGLYPQINDTGIILDLGIHDYDLCRFLFGEIDTLYALDKCVYNQHEDSSVALVKLQNGINGIIENSWITPYKLRHIQVIGTKGVVDADLINCTLKVDNHIYNTEYKINKYEPLRIEIGHLIDCIINNKEPYIGLYDGKMALDIALNILDSSQKQIIKKV